VDDPSAAIGEARRVLKATGKLILLEHVHGEGRTARWQERLTPLHRKLAGNCHLNRDTLATVAAAGFDVQDVERIELPGTHALVRPGIQGVATKTSS
jgi:ubiquinone/menaquinone biosynthesis C-methylase UbiE